MASYKRKVKFPCGYEYETETNFSVFQDFDTDDQMPTKCPLHGKECRK